MMPRTLFTKLALVLALLLLGVGLIYGLISFSLSRHYQQELLQNLNRDLAHNLLTDRNLVANGELNQDALKETFNYFMMVNPSIEIYLLDKTGRILSYSADPGKVKRTHVDIKPIKDFLEKKDFPLLGDDPRSFERQKVFSVCDVPSENQDKGYLYVVLRGEEYERIEKIFQDSFILQISGAALLISLVVALFVGLYLFRFLTRRLNNLAGLMQGFSQNDFSEHIPYPEDKKRGDEIELLGCHYNKMAEHIQKQLTDLKQQDNLRRELVANVSHDLRTPLAALQGYIETLQLMGAKLDGQTHDEYLNIALKNSRRLTNLVEELFELAKLDARDISLKLEAFSIAELIQDIIHKFQVLANDKNIALEMDAPEKLSFVKADIGLIERVLENLISNALQHTPASGKIIVQLREHDNKVDVMVTDTGKGIAEKDLPHIFTRFYRADSSEKGDTHAGLGLAIAKHIVALHNSSIKVESRLNKGTKFYFWLDCA
ncbi:MAG: HAMP domain-containing histidine kinase [Gammaproteobacteria bacterium]|nr:HAMP domain-containing histidine kinase [Gammaproteobacteria bacterium]